MNLHLHYALPDGEVIDVNHILNFGDKGVLNWLHVMVEAHSDLIFFFTVDTTDIW